MYRYFMKWFNIFIVGLLAVSCGSSKKTQNTVSTIPEKPEHYEVVPISTFSVPIALNIKPLLTVVEKENDPNFTNDKWPSFDEEDCFRYKYRFTRSPFKVSAQNNHIKVEFQGRYQIAGSKALCVLGKKVGPWVTGSCGFDGEALRRVNLEIASDIRILPSHHVYSKTYLSRINPIDKCEITVMQTDITSVIMDSIKSSVNGYAQTIDKLVSDINQSPYFEKWRKKKIHALGIDNYGFLVIQPQHYNLSPFQIRNDSILLSVGFTGRNYFFSDTLHYPSSYQLPMLTNYDEPAGIDAYLDIQYAYDSLVKILKDSIGNKPYTLDGKTFVVNDIQLKSNNHNIDIRIDFSGYKTGTIQITGKPELDTAQQVLKLSKMKASLSSKDILLKIAGRWIEKTIVKEVSGMAMIDIKKLMAEEKESIEKTMYQELMPGIFSTGSIESIKVVGLICREKDLRLQVKLKGDVKIQGTLTPALLSWKP